MLMQITLLSAALFWLAVLSEEGLQAPRADYNYLYASAIYVSLRETFQFRCFRSRVWRRSLRKSSDRKGNCAR